MDPGWESVRGSRSDAYRQVWVHIYEADARKIITAAQVRRALGNTGMHRASIYRAMDLAASVGLCRRIKHRRRVAWQRRTLPPVIALDWMLRQSSSLTTAVQVLQALESSAYIEPCKGGYRHKP